MRQVSAAEVSPQWPILEPLEGCRERPIALSKPVCVAGDRVRVNLALRDATISRAHAIFISDGTGAYFRDLASLNHVFVNEEPVREAPLRQGDVLKIGPYAFRCDGGLPATGDEPDGRSTAPPAELRTPDASVHVPLNVRRTTLLGTRDDCDVKMSGNVSPAHAVIFELRNKHYIRDLRSVSGTFINGRKVGQAELRPGDEIRIGESELIYAGGTESESEGTLAGILAADSAAGQILPAPESSGAPLAVESDSAPKAEAGSAPADDLETIPLIEETELKSLAQEFAQETQPDAGHDVLPLASGPSDSSVIPLLDDSESGPGLPPEPVVEPAGLSATDSIIPLAPEDSSAEALKEPAAPARKPKGRKREASEPRAKSRPVSESKVPGKKAIR